MRKQGHIIIKGIVQGVGFRPFVYAQATAWGIVGTVQNNGSEVHIEAFGENFENFLASITQGTPLSVIDSIQIAAARENRPSSFTIMKSQDGIRTGFIPPDIATCPECVDDIFQKEGRYEEYFATSCVNCGPRYSIIKALPYDRERTAMLPFPPCINCEKEYEEPGCRRHHAQTIACETCGPRLSLLNSEGNPIQTDNPVIHTARLLDEGAIVAIRGNGGFHLACTEDQASELKRRLRRTEQPLALMASFETIQSLAYLTEEEIEELNSPAAPILILNKKQRNSHEEISNLHTIGCMLPYTGLHHLLFASLQAPLLIMTSANAPGYPMITDTAQAKEKLSEVADAYLTHNREIINRCDDSVARSRYIIRLSRGFAPRRIHHDLGKEAILGVGPELNSTVTLYSEGFCVTSPHVGNVRNPKTFEYLQETIERLSSLLKPDIRIIAHDMHPQFLSTRLAKEMAEDIDASLVPVQHHMAHISATCPDECVGIAIDGVGYGTDGTVWGGEIFAGSVPHLTRSAHLLPVPMAGGDLATTYPERMLFGILPDNITGELLASRGWTDTELTVIGKQVNRRFNTTITTSCGRILDAASALLGICRKKTYDGEPAMKLESVAWMAEPDTWDLSFQRIEGKKVLDTSSLMKQARYKYLNDPSPDNIRTIASSFQYNLARGIAELAMDTASEFNIQKIALSGGVAYNSQIRRTIRSEIQSNGYEFVIRSDIPLGDGCISYGQCIWAGKNNK